MMLAVAVQSADEQLQRRAVELASVVVESARRSGGYRLSGHPERISSTLRSFRGFQESASSF